MIYLVLGGARSGKSGFAEKLASEQSDNITYVATATAGDNEMRERIKHHQRSRPQDWLLIEEPFNLSKVVNENDFADKTLIIECMTLWLSNWLCTNDSQGWDDERKAFIKALSNTKANIVIVSNEVGSGVIPLGELSRDFVDRAGWLNQTLANLADKAILVVAGCAINLKPNNQSSEI